MEKKDVIINTIGLIIISIIVFAPYVFIYSQLKKENLKTTTKIEKCTNKEYTKDYVSYNTKSHIYHDLDCECALQCTVNCITIERKEAIERGGRPCKVCNGGNPTFNDDDEEDEDSYDYNYDY